MPVLRKFVSCFVILLFINACYELWAIGRTWVIPVTYAIAKGQNV